MYNKTLILLCASLLFILFSSSSLIGQASTVTYTSTNPGDGPTGGATYCMANGWMAVSSNYCGQSISPAFSSNMNSSGIMFLAVNATSTGRATNYPMTGGNFLLFTDISGTTPELMSEFIIRSLNSGSFPVDISSVQVYHEAGSAINFTFQAGTTYRGSELGSKIESIPSGVVTTVSLASEGFYGFNTVQILPASNVVFGANAFAISDAVLPVEWLDFQATKNKNSINLSWTTLQEINTSHFEIQRKAPGEAAFAPIGMLDAAGMSDETRPYIYTDYKPLLGRLQYRIRQVDIDGKHSYSQVEEIVVEPTLTLSPNPTNGVVYIQTPDQAWAGQLLDLQGKTVLEIPLGHSEINMSSFSVGIYILDLHNEKGNKFKEKIVKF